MLELINKVTEVKDGDKSLLKKVYKHYPKLKQVEQADVMDYIFSMLYVWLSKYYAGIDFLVKCDKTANAR